jgi:hypothetical protein
MRDGQGSERALKGNAGSSMSAPLYITQCAGGGEDPYLRITFAEISDMHAAYALHAAAPELYEALLEMVNKFDTGERGLAPVDRARAALAKAGGKS